MNDKQKTYTCYIPAIGGPGAQYVLTASSDRDARKQAAALYLAATGLSAGAVHLSKHTK